MEFKKTKKWNALENKLKFNDTILRIIIAQ